MEIAREPITGDGDVLGVVGNLVRVHHCSRHLYRTHKVEVIVAQVVCELFNLFLGQRSRVIDDVVVDGKGSSYGRLVSNHVEVEAALCILVLDQASVNYCTWRRVFVVIVSFLSESGVYSFVH